MLACCPPVEMSAWLGFLSIQKNVGAACEVEASACEPERSRPPQSRRSPRGPKESFHATDDSPRDAGLGSAYLGRSWIALGLRLCARRSPRQFLFTQERPHLAVELLVNQHGLLRFDFALRRPLHKAVAPANRPIALHHPLFAHGQNTRQVLLRLQRSMHVGRLGRRHHELRVERR